MGFVLTERDFDAYARSKWKSNAFNRERLEVKEKLLKLGKSVAGIMVGQDGSPLDCEATVEHPALWNHKQVDSQRLSFARNRASRKELDAILESSRPLALMVADPSPDRTHAAISVTIDVDWLTISVLVHSDAAIDRDNLKNKLAKADEREALSSLCRGLGAGFKVAVTGGPQIACEAIEEADWDTVGAALTNGGWKGAWLSVGRKLARADAIALGADVEDQIRGSLTALLGVYHFIAWTRKNDHLELSQRLRERSTKKKQRGLARGDKIRIVAGMFAGRPGLIQDIDAKGALKVLVGKIPVKVRADEVEKL